MEFQNESWKNHRILFFGDFLLATFEIFLRAMCAIGHFHSAWIMEILARIMENSRKNHGISFWEMAGNPAIAIESSGSLLVFQTTVSQNIYYFLSWFSILN